MFGYGKVLLLCTQRQMFIQSFYNAGAQRAKRLVEGEWLHSLLINGHPVPIDTPAKRVANGDEFYADFPIDRSQAMAIARSSKVGHAMQLGRDSPLFVGYQIEIPKPLSPKVSAFIENCYL
jgi:hypothetical protein